jgi:hypothetical protein
VTDSPARSGLSSWRSSLRVLAGVLLATALAFVATWLLARSNDGWHNLFIGIACWLGFTLVGALVLLGMSRVTEGSGSAVYRDFGLGALVAFVVAPFAWVGAPSILGLDPAFPWVCRSAHASVFERVATPRGVLLLNDGGRDFNAEFFLNQTSLDFVERPAPGGYERLTVIGERHRGTYPKNTGRTEFRKEPIPAATAEYEIRLYSRPHAVDWIREMGIEVRRQSDQKVIAATSSFVHGPTRRRCPEDALALKTRLAFMKRALGLQD